MIDCNMIDRAKRYRNSFRLRRIICHSSFPACPGWAFGNPLYLLIKLFPGSWLKIKKAVATNNPLAYNIILTVAQIQRP
ncbi:hypothetical protein D1AOALGA4SA_4310 [Olavius algarvensis Delta 1 endosymbiont]|nr:hypothetical protein D1AOALGA4SA_4310 [Olavius algarvensis Delta 1 endosymbiont]